MQETNHIVDRWYSTREICIYLGVSWDTLLTWIAEKELPSHKVGRNGKSKSSEVDDWVKTRKASV